MTTTRGRGCTSTRSWPTAASRAICCGPSVAPGPSASAPAARSSPARRTHSPVRTLVRIATRATPPSVSSSGTTASAPGGIGAPVMIRMHRPGPMPDTERVPATTSPTTGNTSGLSAWPP